MLALFLQDGLRAQPEPPFDPGVLRVDRSFHHGGVRGRLGWAGSFFGSISIASDETLVGSIQGDDRFGDGSLYSNATALDGAYYFDLDGQVMLDFWPGQPGVDQHWFWSDPGATVLHYTPPPSAPFPMLWIATGAAQQASAAQLFGAYVVRSVRVSMQGANLTTRDVDGVLSCDGAGQGTLVGTERTMATGGAASQRALTLGFAYSIAPDGTLVTFGGRGAVTEDGELFFLVTQDLAQQEFGLWIGVKQGHSGDLGEVAGRLSVSGMSFDQLSMPAAPRMSSLSGTVELQASGPSLGSAEVSGWRAVQASLPPHESFPLHSSTAIGAVRSGPGEVTFADAELQWAFTFSPNGRYWIGRELGNPASLLFGVRQTAPCEVIGPAIGSYLPGLGLRGFPQIGKADWGLRVNHGRGGAPAVLAFAAAPTAGWLMVDQYLWVDPATALATAGFVLGGAPGVPDVGSAEHSVPVPNNPAFLGLSMAVQALVFESLRPTGVAMSRGLQVHIGQ